MGLFQQYTTIEDPGEKTAFWMKHEADIKVEMAELYKQAEAEEKE